jgi:hypothetical protein
MPMLVSAPTFGGILFIVGTPFAGFLATWFASAQVANLDRQTAKLQRTLETSDYYTKDVGTWGGKGAEILELEGDVQRKDFVALANNRWPGPKGKRLTARMNKTRLEDVIDKTGVPAIDPETGTAKKREVSNRRAGYDFTFSVPKSVSLYLASMRTRLSSK